MSKVLVIVIMVFAAAAGVAAQTQDELRQSGSVRNASVKIGTPRIGNEVNAASVDQPLTRNIDRVIYLGPRTTYLQEGLSTKQVRRLLGKPATISERSENGSVVTTYEFERAEGRILIVEFVNDMLTRSRTEIHQ